MSPVPAPLPPYRKPWLSHTDQVQMLADRGLIVADAIAAEHFLSHINYYRFSGYCLAFEQQRHQFFVGTTFEQVQFAYEFDMALRDMVTEALEAVEVDLRSIIAYEFGRTHGAFGHANPASFFHTFMHQDWIKRLRTEAARSNELFISHFRNAYAEYPDLPAWVVTEVMSFGSLSQMFKGMHRTDQRAVATHYGVQSSILVSWMHHLTYVRNLCAHHSRLWDRSYAIKPTMPMAGRFQPPHVPANNRLFATLVLLRHLLRRCPAVNLFAIDWRNRINTLMQTLPTVAYPLTQMGMPANWDQHPVWS